MSLCICELNIDEDTMELVVSDVAPITKVPEVIKNIVKDQFHNRVLRECGLPEVLYLGENEVRVVGAMKYGDLAFIEVEGDIKDVENGLICITAYKEDATYEELREGKDEYIKEINNKYSEGCVVE